MVVTTKDMQLLRALVEIYSYGRESDAAARLGGELDRATVVAPGAVPLDVVTMNSRVVFEDEAGARREVLLVYPPAATGGAPDRVSVLSQTGMALLGLAVGEAIDWPMPEGGARRLRIVAVLYQPESFERAATALSS
jgi:regulator of nucleoside diphosphate kinase